MSLIPANNKLPQPPNDSWHAIADEPVPCGVQVMLSDANKQFVWIGCVSHEDSPAPSLPATGQVAVSQAPAFWSHIADQV